MTTNPRCFKSSEMCVSYVEELDCKLLRCFSNLSECHFKSYSAKQFKALLFNIYHVYNLSSHFQTEPHVINRLWSSLFFIGLQKNKAFILLLS